MASDLGLGRRPSIDPRNAAYPMARKLPAPTAILPIRKTWSFSGDPLDQGGTGTCCGHAAAHFIHASPMRHAGFLSPFDIYREAVLLDEYASNDGEATLPDAQLQEGSSGTGVAEALRKRGILKEFLWASTMREAVEWVLTRGPVMIGSDWLDGMFNPTAQGFVKVDESPLAGGHEYLMLGADQRRGIAHFVNSWGPRWNKAATLCKPGHFLMSYEDLEKLFHRGGDAVSAIEQKRVP